MSEENVEIVRAYIDAYNGGDLDSALGHLADDFEYDGSRALGPDSRRLYDRDGFRDFLVDFASSWESPVRIEPHEFLDAGERVIVPWTFHATGRDGLDLDARVTMVFTVRDGAIAGICMYQDRGEALEAAGVSG
jgi:ketosteroid isomerase-like protein